MKVLTKDLEAVVSRINLITGSPQTSYTSENGKSVANIGNYHLGYAYGGVCLQRMSNSSGGVSIPISSGYTTKKDLYNLMHAFINGVENVKS